MKRVGLNCLLAVCGILFLAGGGFAYEINDKFSIGGIMAGIYQYESLSDAAGYDSLGRGLLAFQPEASFTPTENDEIFAKFGFGAGNGLMEDGKSPFILAPWGGDTQDGVQAGGIETTSVSNTFSPDCWRTC